MPRTGRRGLAGNQSGHALKKSKPLARCRGSGDCAMEKSNYSKGGRLGEGEEEGSRW